MGLWLRADNVVEESRVELKCKDVFTPSTSSAFIPPPAARCSSWFVDQLSYCFSKEGIKRMVNHYREPAGEKPLTAKVAKKSRSSQRQLPSDPVETRPSSLS